MKKCVHWLAIKPDKCLQLLTEYYSRCLLISETVCKSGERQIIISKDMRVPGVYIDTLSLYVKVVIPTPGSAPSCTKWQAHSRFIYTGNGFNQVWLHLHWVKAHAKMTDGLPGDSMCYLFWLSPNENERQKDAKPLKGTAWCKLGP